jgi:hypothetical protein
MDAGDRAMHGAIAERTQSGLRKASEMIITTKAGTHYFSGSAQTGSNCS